MSTHIDSKHNQCYSIEAARFYGGDSKGVMIHFAISDSERTTAIALPKKDAMDFCINIIKSLNEMN